MARIRIDAPKKAIFTTDIPVRISDINYGNHLGNDALLSILHESRLRFLNQLGYSELNIEGIGLIMTDVMISYRGQSFYGDVLTINIGINELSRIGMDIHYSVNNRPNGRLIALAKTGMTFFDYDKQKPAGAPARFIDKIQALDSGGNND